MKYQVSLQISALKGKVHALLVPLVSLDGFIEDLTAGASAGSLVQEAESACQGSSMGAIPPSATSLSSHSISGRRLPRAANCGW